MSLEYPEPEHVKTTRRCQFSLPLRRYNCRRIGFYALADKCYCAPHYDIKWKAANPVYGQQHEWHIHINKFTGEPYPYETCRRCGSVRQHEGFPQEPCGGKMPVITLRGAHA